MGQLGWKQMDFEECMMVLKKVMGSETKVIGKQTWNESVKET